MPIVRICSCALHAVYVVGVVAAAALAWPTTRAHAQAPPVSVLDPKAPVPALRYRSTLAGHGDKLPASGGSWQQANDLTHQIGGWRSYARQAQQPDEPAAPAPAGSAPMPARPAPIHKH